VGLEGPVPGVNVGVVGPSACTSGMPKEMVLWWFVEPRSPGLCSIVVSPSIPASTRETPAIMSARRDRCGCPPRPASGLCARKAAAAWTARFWSTGREPPTTMLSGM
jgi:hypothetical protein